MKSKLSRIFILFSFSLLLLLPNSYASDNFDVIVRKSIMNALSCNEKPIESKIKDGTIMTREEFDAYRKNSTIKDDTKLRSVPNDGYIYVFDQLYITHNNKKDYFRYIGEYTVANNTKSNMTVTYKQEKTVTVSWNVAASISASATIGNKFLGAIETEIGASVSRSSTTTSGTMLGVSATCTPFHRIALTAYQGGIYAKATMVYSKYHKSGGSVGKYTESVSGTVLKDNSFNIKAIETKIKKR